MALRPFTLPLTFTVTLVLGDSLMLRDLISVYEFITKYPQLWSITGWFVLCFWVVPWLSKKYYPDFKTTFVKKWYQYFFWVSLLLTLFTEAWIFREIFSPVVYYVIFQGFLVLVFVSIINYLVIFKYFNHNKVILAILPIFITVSLFCIISFVIPPGNKPNDEELRNEIEKKDKELRDRWNRIAQLQMEMQNLKNEQPEQTQPVKPPSTGTKEEKKGVANVSQIEGKVKEVTLSYPLNHRGILGEIVSMLKNEDEAVNRLVHLLDNEDQDLCLKSAVLLSASKGRSKPDIEKKIKETLIEKGNKLDKYLERIFILEILKSFQGKEVIDFFMDCARFDDYPSVRQRAIEGLVAFKSDESQKNLMYLAKYDNEASVRRTAVDALGIIGTDTPLKKELLLDILRKNIEEPQVLTAAVQSLEKIYTQIGEKGREEIGKGINSYILEGRDKSSKRTAIYVTSKLKSTTFVDTLIALLEKETDIYTIRDAVDALLKMNDKRAVVPLTNILKEDKLPMSVNESEQKNRAEIHDKIKNWLETINILKTK